MVAAQLGLLVDALSIGQRVTSSGVGLLQEMALKYNTLLVKLIDLVKVIKHYTLYELVVHQILQILVLQSLQLLNALEKAISY